MAREVKKEATRETTSGRETVSRRKFLRQTAETAALSLFGVLGLDAVMDRVLQRLEERRGIDRLADQVTAGLRRTGAAHAAPAPT